MATSIPSIILLHTWLIHARINTIPFSDSLRSVLQTHTLHLHTSTCAGTHANTHAVTLKHLSQYPLHDAHTHASKRLC